MKDHHIIIKIKVENTEDATYLAGYLTKATKEGIDSLNTAQGWFLSSKLPTLEAVSIHDNPQVKEK